MIRAIWLAIWNMDTLMEDIGYTVNVICRRKIYLYLCSLFVEDEVKGSKDIEIGQE